MKTVLLKVISVALLAGATLLPLQSAQAWGGPWGGNMFGMDFGQSGPWSRYGYGGWGGPWGYPGYGWGGPWGHPYGGWGYPYYGYPTIVAPAAPATSK